MNKLIFLSLLSLTISFCTGCKKKDLCNCSTLAITNITATTAETGGNLPCDNYVDIIVRGVCWSTSQSPTIDDLRTTDAYGTGKFTSMLIGLTPNTRYYVRAYATNSLGTTYCDEITFTTLSSSK